MPGHSQGTTSQSVLGPELSVYTTVLISFACLHRRSQPRESVYTSVLSPCVCVHQSSHFACLSSRSVCLTTLQFSVLCLPTLQFSVPFVCLHPSSQPCVFSTPQFSTLCLPTSQFLAPFFCLHLSCWSLCLHCSYQPSVFVYTAILSPMCLSTPHFSALCQSVP